MGRRAVYISIDEPRLEALWWLEDAAFRAAFADIDEDESLGQLHIGKLWDALHCTFTGKSACSPVEDNPLSESIVGVCPKVYDDGDYSTFVSVIDNSDLPKLIAALERMDEGCLKAMLDPARMEKEGVYPNGIWTTPADDLVAEMFHAVEAIISFFRGAMSSGHHVLATIV